MQPDQSTEPNEPKPAPKAPEESKSAAAEHEASKASKPGQDLNVHRAYWERTRTSRTITMLLFQALLWVNLFSSSRGASVGFGTFILTPITMIMLTYLLISVTNFGNTFDIATTLFFGFSTLLADFSTLYWNYGTSINFTESLTRLDAIYLSVGILSTAGTGNIAAVSQVARGLQIMQMVLDIGFVVFAVSLALARISSRVEGRQE